MFGREPVGERHAVLDRFHLDEPRVVIQHALDKRVPRELRQLLCDFRFHALQNFCRACDQPHALVAADIVLAMAQEPSIVYTGSALWGLHMGLTQGLLAAFVAAAASAELRGTAFGVFSLLSGVALLAGSTFAGWLWDAQGPGATFSAGAILTALAWLLLLVLGGPSGLRAASLAR